EYRAQHGRRGDPAVGADHVGVRLGGPAGDRPAGHRGERHRIVEGMDLLAHARLLIGRARPGPVRPGIGARLYGTDPPVTSGAPRPHDRSRPAVPAPAPQPARPGDDDSGAPTAARIRWAALTALAVAALVVGIALFVTGTGSDTAAESEDDG